MSRTFRRVALLAVGALACTPLLAHTQPAAPTPTTSSAVDKPLLQADRNYYFNNSAPAVPDDQGADAQVGVKAERSETKLAGQTNTGFPAAAKQLAKREALATTKGISPRVSAKRAGEPEVTNAKLLTLLVEFDPNAKDDFSGFNRYDSETGECIVEPAGTLLSGPVHNQLPNPATIGRKKDNNTLWVKNFSSRFYEKMIYTKEGVSQKIRKDLEGGVSIKGQTVRNFYDEMSKGRYQLGGETSQWLMLPHSEAFYSADSCAAGEASDVGHPTNPRGTGQMAIDAVAALVKAEPNFAWADYDVEDQQDVDGDGDLYEPNGVLDHVVVLHAGADQADDGGAQGTYAEWSSSQVVGSGSGGIDIPGTGLKVFNYTTQPEDAGIGVIAHEFGHDLGLPDLYDSIGPSTDTDVGWWDLMSTGSHSGEIFQTMPTHMGAWSKYVLGWVDPKVLDYNDDISKVYLGQASRPQKGTDAAVRINLPTRNVTLGAPHSGELAWWTSNDQDQAKNTITRTIEVPQGDDVRFWSWNDYTIEELWDYGFIETSTDGGTTWKQEVVKNEAGETVSTNDDPHGNLVDFGDMKNGLTGDSGGYRHDWVDLTPYAGDSIQLRLTLMTDAAFQERNWFADDFSVTADGDTVWSDDVEDGTNGWTARTSSTAGTTGAGWVQTSGSFDYEQYYLAEWRTFDGYDRGLKTPYVTDYKVDGEWKVRRTPYNAPGLLVWLRDQSQTFNDLTNNLYDQPSIGSKGETLLVDAHPQPARFTGTAAEANPSLTDNLSSRQQANDVAFGPVGRYAFSSCVPDGSSNPYKVLCNSFPKRTPIDAFNDASTWYPGLEYRPDLDAENPLFFRDVDASVVVPSLDNTIYSTRIVDKNGKLLYRQYGIGLGGGHVTGTGNPVDGRPAIPDEDYGTYADLSLGVKIRILKTKDSNRAAWINIRPGNKDTSPEAVAKRVAAAKAEQKALAKQAAQKAVDKKAGR